MSHYLYVNRSGEKSIVPEAPNASLFRESIAKNLIHGVTLEIVWHRGNSGLMIVPKNNDPRFFGVLGYEETKTIVSCPFYIAGCRECEYDFSQVLRLKSLKLCGLDPLILDDFFTGIDIKQAERGWDD